MFLSSDELLCYYFTATLLLLYCECLHVLFPSDALHKHPYYCVTTSLLRLYCDFTASLQTLLRRDCVLTDFTATLLVLYTRWATQVTLLLRHFFFTATLLLRYYSCSKCPTVKHAISTVLRRIRDMTHVYKRHDSCVYETWHMCIRDMTHVYKRHDSCVYEEIWVECTPKAGSIGGH